MNKKNILILFYIFLLIIPAFGQKGSLVIIGGGKRTNEITEKIIGLAGGKESKFLVIPMASSEMLSSAKSSMEEFIKAGCSNIDFLICDKSNADDDTTLNKLSGVTGIYFTGGDQNLLTKALLGTKFLDKIKFIYQNGGVVSGTSAGAAVMSRIMITGDEMINKDSLNSFNMIKKGNIQTAEGFGFLKNEIIDQHFTKRKRFNRLLSLVIENGDKTGIGIDESTAIVVKQGKTFEVIGESSVMVLLPGNKKFRTDRNGNFGADNLNMSLLISGDKFDLIKKCKIK